MLAALEWENQVYRPTQPPPGVACSTLQRHKLFEGQENVSKIFVRLPILPASVPYVLLNKGFCEWPPAHGRTLLTQNVILNM